MEQEDLNRLIADAKNSEPEQIIRCTESSGRVVDFAHTGAVGMWIRAYREAGQGFPTSEDAVYGTMKLCDPDVELIDYDDSIYAEFGEQNDASGTE